MDRPILSQVRFHYEDTARRDQLRQQARSQTPSYYRIHRGPIDHVISELRNLYESGKASEDYAAFQARAEEAKWDISPAAHQELRRLASDEGGKNYDEFVERLKAAMLEEYTAEPRAKEERQPASAADFIRVLVESKEETESAETVRDVKSAELVFLTPKVLEGRASSLARVFPNPLHDTVTGIILRGLQSAPILQFDPERTAEAMRATEEAVGKVTLTVERGQPLIDPKAGEPVVLTEEHIRRLRLHEEAYQAFLNGRDPEAVQLRERRFLRQAGLAAIFFLLSAGLFVYVKQTRPRLLAVPTRTLAFAGLILFTLLVVRAVDVRWAYKELLLAPALAAGSILTITFDRRFALGSMSIASVLLVLAVGGDIDLWIITVIGMAITTTMLGQIRTRTRIINAGLLTALAVAVAALAFGLIRQQEISSALERSAWAAGSVLAGALLVQGILPFVERVFGIATALTLLEWRDASKPLLQRLAREAPGTYAHSLVLSTMAEAACEGIGADGLLAGVGALYHDIGKISKPDYFAENQETTSISRHDKLSPTMSLLIIVGHVKDGVEMAKEYGLPRVLHPFIDEHHGTTLIRYFHHVASEKQPKIAVGKHDRSVSEAEFRYPGPKPHSRETAILMLCDGVEGAVRSLTEPTAGRIEGVVHQIVMDRLNDGQFDECDITLKELRLVEESLVKSLLGFYHGRMAYPKGDQKPERVSDVREEAVATQAAVS